MDNIILFDDPTIRGSLLPFTFTRPVAEIRVGILKISDKWERATGRQVSFSTQDYLSEKFPCSSQKSIWINGALCPNETVLNEILSLKEGEVLAQSNTVLAYLSSGENAYNPEKVKQLLKIESKAQSTLILKSWNIFEYNGSEIKNDYLLLTDGRTSIGIQDPHTVIYGEGNIFVEEGARIKAAVLNAENGPIYIGKNTEIQEGALIRGPFALCEGSTVNMGAKLRGDTTVGPHSKVGGEISNSVIFGYSNKGHEGFLGNSVIGEWCNLGADTNTSNLKNNYAAVKLWDYTKGGFANTGLQFCGLMMGDHAKCGINTMFNTGTVVGVGANVFGDGYPRNFIPSFSWGGAAGFSTFQVRKFEETATAVMKRRGISYSQVDKEIIQKVFDLTRHYRIWEKES